MLPKFGSAQYLDLEAYFGRIGFTGVPGPDLATLSALHYLHPVAIPFENLSTLIGEPVRLEPRALAEKLISAGRGGYCFEQNALFQHALTTLGFEVIPLAARVVWHGDAASENPRTHMALIVVLDDERYLCDVGFGAATMTGPIRLETMIEQSTPHDIYRIVGTPDLYRLELRLDGRWRGVFEFDLQAQRPVDYEAMNFFVSMHPNSVFRSVLMACRPHADGRYSLRDNEFSHYADGALAERRVLASAGELARLLREAFAISLPDTPALSGLLERIAANPAR